MRHAVAAFWPFVDTITVIGRDDDLPALREALPLDSGKLRFAMGGATRQASVYNGMLALLDEPGDAIVLVHDAARPLVSGDIITRCIASALEYGSGVAASCVYDTLKRADKDGFVRETVDRTGIWAAQTPQAFRLDLLRRAFDAATASGFCGADEASLVERLDEDSVKLVQDGRQNIKITTPADMAFAEQWLHGVRPDIRVGNGYDIHRLAPGRQLWLGGIQIEFDKGLDGHSDADVVLHALCDALLGAAGMPDIGQLYPNTDERFRGASSMEFLRDVAARLAKDGWNIGNADCTLIAEQPKISAYSGRMRQTIAQALGVGECCINIKATTNEGLGALGAGLGIACHATCCIHRAESR